MLSLSSYLLKIRLRKNLLPEKEEKFAQRKIAFEFHFMKWTYMPALVGTGKDRKSIWSQKFEDEIVPYLKVSFPWNYFFVRW